MTACKWSRDAGEYLTDDGQPCKRDEHGDRTYHCTARRSCSQHVGMGELTCARCLGRVRQDIRAIREQAPLALVEALNGGVNSPAAMIAGPAANYDTFTSRRALDRRWLYQHIPQHNLIRAMSALLADDDELHPFSVLTRWHWLTSAALGDDLPEVMTLMDSANYLDRKLNIIAQNEGCDFPKMRSEINKCRNHLDNALHNSSRPDQGELCPTCIDKGEKPERLRREYGHWVDLGKDRDGNELGWRLHYSATPTEDDEAEEHDRWVCPRNREHVWSEAAYRSYVEERTSA